MIDIDDGDYVACICEGHSEITIMNLLLGDDSLCFKREKLLDGEVLSTRYYRDSNLFTIDILRWIMRVEGSLSW